MCIPGNMGSGAALHVGHNWFQTAPMDPPQDTAEPLSHGGGASGKTFLRKCKMQHGSEEKKV